ncbi:MAG TPA: polyphosphate kinase 2 family protein [Actinomycetota bacterium]|jgi:PPK2 family polyphosphate:nucleotide phosphotransferase
MPERWRVPPGKRVRLDSIDPGSTAGAPGGKAETEVTVADLHRKLAGLHDRLWAEGRRSLLVVLQGMDTAGKDGTIRHVFGSLAPQATRVTAFKVPNDAERAHDFLWRVHRAAPAHGEIGIFNRSHYEDVLVARVHGLVPEDVWRARYGLINGFEKLLAHGGTTILKFFLYISKDEQRKRLEERLNDPTKRWKFQVGDLVERRLWDDYCKAYEDAIEATSMEHAPWYVIPADHKWYRNWATTRILVSTLEGMHPRYPEGEDLSGVTIT